MTQLFCEVAKVLARPRCEASRSSLVGVQIQPFERVLETSRDSRSCFRHSQALWGANPLPGILLCFSYSQIVSLPRRRSRVGCACAPKNRAPAIVPRRSALRVASCAFRLMYGWSWGSWNVSWQLLGWHTQALKRRCWFAHPKFYLEIGHSQSLNGDVGW